MRFCAILQKIILDLLLYFHFIYPYHPIMIVQQFKLYWKCEYTVCAIELTAMRFLDIFIVFARNNLMNIMCKVGDYILKVNNIAKTSTQTNTQKRST